MLMVCLSRDANFLPAASFSKLEPPPSGVEDDDDFVILGREDTFFRAVLFLFNAEDEDEDEEEETNPHGCSKHHCNAATVPTWRRAENRKPRETREKEGTKKYQERKREREREREREKRDKRKRGR